MDSPKIPWLGGGVKCVLGGNTCVYGNVDNDDWSMELGRR